ncbi:MAG: carboxypeptidase-like regulatory domain-containing protein [Proteobacteria bacterium]|nr:carboxypeptidase-like regulatory domain-containing protein [Pseudomonadota bacterium]
MMRSPVALLVAGLCSIIVANPARGDLSEQSQTNRARGALPGVHRVATAEPIAPGIALFAGAGYGFASSVLAADDSHHRATGALAAGLAIRSWLALAVRLDGRYDRHKGDEIGTTGDRIEQGYVGDPRFMARVRTQIAPSLSLAGQMTLWLPGQNAPSVVPSATSIDALAVMSVTPPGWPLRVGANLGFRLDNSAESSDDTMRLSEPDRLSLGVSEANAVLLGVGAAYWVDPIEVVGEWTWDVLIGDRAPDLGQSPLRFTAGMRVVISSSVVAQLLLEVNAADHPGAGPADPLVPFEPRISMHGGLFFHFGGPARPGALSAPVPETGPGSITGQILGRDDRAIAGATVVVAVGNDQRQMVSDAQGRFAVSDLSSGSVAISVQKFGYKGQLTALTLKPGEQRELSLRLAMRSEAQLPPAQLRGFVRSYGGRGVRATLRVEPIGVEVTTGDDGSFRIDLEPGTYEILVSASGYRQQRRPVAVRQGGVLIVNLDLKPKK